MITSSISKILSLTILLSSASVNVQAFDVPSAEQNAEIEASMRYQAAQPKQAKLDVSRFTFENPLSKRVVEATIFFSRTNERRAINTTASQGTVIAAGGSGLFLVSTSESLKATTSKNVTGIIGGLAGILWGGSSVIQSTHAHKQYSGDRISLFRTSKAYTELAAEKAFGKEMAEEMIHDIWSGLDTKEVIERYIVAKDRGSALEMIKEAEKNSDIVFGLNDNKLQILQSIRAEDGAALLKAENEKRSSPTTMPSGISENLQK